jgi:hypothetical protein
MLGIVLSPAGQVPNSFPYGVGYSYGGNGTFMCPDDPQQYRRGEAGFYGDTPLGAPIQEGTIVAGLLPHAIANRGLVSKWREKSMLKKAGLGSSIPSDHQLYQTYGFIPHMTGWVASKQGYAQSPWYVKNYRPGPLPGNGFAGPQIRGLGDLSPDTSAVLSAMNQQNTKMFTLTLVSALAVSISAVVAIVRNARALGLST